MDRGAWRAIVPGRAKSGTQWSDEAQHRPCNVTKSYLYRHVFNIIIRNESQCLQFQVLDFEMVIEMGDLCQKKYKFSSIPQCSSITKSCPILCDPIDCTMPGFLVYHQLPELVQTLVHQVGDAIQPSHPLLFSSPPDFNLSQHQGVSQ